jgi:lipid-A-disaccharide synthase
LSDLGLIAGEASGDLLGATLVEALGSRHPGLVCHGIAGPRMVAAGVTPLADSERLAVNGYVEVLRHLPGLLRLRREVVRYFLARPPSVFVGIDAPDFNFGVEEKLKAAGIPTVHFVSPSLWAWRGERIHRIARAVSRMLVVFPFEEAIYREAGIPVDYVGHPLADTLPLQPDVQAARQTLGLQETGEVVALLPGSRVGEVTRLAPLMLAAAERLVAQRPGMRFLLPAATTRLHTQLAGLLRGRNLPVSLLAGQAHLAMAAADSVLLASGTATLEAALLKKPMVITYRLPALSYQLMKRRAYLPYVGLPNILLGRFAVPELIQDQATPAALARALADSLDDVAGRGRLVRDFTELHGQLRCGAAARIAAAVSPYLA